MLGLFFFPQKSSFLNKKFDIDALSLKFKKLIT